MGKKKKGKASAPVVVSDEEVEGLGGETMSKMLQRHKLEIRALQKEVKNSIQAVKKDKAAKKLAEEKGKQMEEELCQKHKGEILNRKDAELSSSTEGDKAPVVTTTEAEEKIARAQRRRDRKKQKELDEIAAINAEKARVAGTSNRELELDTLCQKLSSIGLSIKEIPSDGNCLYHAIADQLKSKFNQSFTALELRKKAATYMKDNQCDFEPFIDTDFDSYIKKVATTNEWGGQVELRALSNALEKPIEVYSSDSDVLIMGEEYKSNTIENDSVLQVTFHRHYYALGEHYNSVSSL